MVHNVIRQRGSRLDPSTGLVNTISAGWSLVAHRNLSFLFLFLYFSIFFFLFYFYFFIFFFLIFFPLSSSSFFPLPSFVVVFSTLLPFLHPFFRFLVDRLLFAREGRTSLPAGVFDLPPHQRVSFTREEDFFSKRN